MNTCYNVYANIFTLSINIYINKLVKIIVVQMSCLLVHPWDLPDETGTLYP